ncbi:hypothetical protein B0H63DRAFT_15076 [Podospora didyma]|uniref:Uncharacterized protein n=1 Tax=Podospora didyma TaxID=330526 RepID=A0AAE0U6Y6_9PEZI|nr:hypothetical protein B0H63DRAFT_15076 [Podospora didyma]
MGRVIPRQCKSTDILPLHKNWPDSYPGPAPFFLSLLSQRRHFICENIVVAQSSSDSTMGDQPIFGFLSRRPSSQSMVDTPPRGISTFTRFFGPGLSNDGEVKPQSAPAVMVGLEARDPADDSEPEPFQLPPPILPVISADAPWYMNPLGISPGSANAQAFGSGITAAPIFSGIWGRFRPSGRSRRHSEEPQSSSSSSRRRFFNSMELPSQGPRKRQARENDEELEVALHDLRMRHLPTPAYTPPPNPSSSQPPPGKYKNIAPDTINGQPVREEARTEWLETPEEREARILEHLREQQNEEFKDEARAFARKRHQVKRSIKKRFLARAGIAVSPSLHGSSLSTPAASHLELATAAHHSIPPLLSPRPPPLSVLPPPNDQDTTPKSHLKQCYHKVSRCFWSAAGTIAACLVSTRMKITWQCRANELKRQYKNQRDEMRRSRKQKQQQELARERLGRQITQSPQRAANSPRQPSLAGSSDMERRASDRILPHRRSLINPREGCPPGIPPVIPLPPSIRRAISLEMMDLAPKHRQRVTPYDRVSTWRTSPAEATRAGPSRASAISVPPSSGWHHGGGGSSSTTPWRVSGDEATTAGGTRPGPSRASAPPSASGHRGGSGSTWPRGGGGWLHHDVEPSGWGTLSLSGNNSRIHMADEDEDDDDDDGIMMKDYRRKRTPSHSRGWNDHEGA